MPKPFTHVIVKYPSKGMDLLFRVSDGMCLACRQELTIIAGTDTNPAKKTHRNFRTESHAIGFLRNLADFDQNNILHDAPCVNFARRPDLEYAASVDEQYGESSLVTASNAVLKN